MKPELLRARLLLVEDHAPTAEILQAILLAAGFSKITHAINIDDATTLLEHQPFDIVLCDFQLGIATGLELVRMIRKHGGVGNINVPVVMITAHAETDRVAEALAAGVDDFLVKPVQPDTLLRCLSDVLERPRSFVKTKAYAGPDRRRRQTTDHGGRREKDRNPESPIPKNKWIVPPKS